MNTYFQRNFITLSVFVVIAMTAVSAVVRADDVPVVEKKTTFMVKDQHMTATVGFREVFDVGLRRRLRSGFATTVKMRFFLFRNGKNSPLAVKTRTLTAVYDLWDERYLLTVYEEGHVKQWRLRSERKVVDRLTSLWRSKIAHTSKFSEGATYFLAGIVEVNPIKPEVLSKVRGWLRKPHRRKQARSGENLFGSFVSIFVNDRIQRAEKSFKFRSPSFFAPK